MPQWGHSSQGAPRSPPSLAYPTEKSLAALPPIQSPSRAVSRKHVIFPPLLKDITPPQVGERPRCCLQGCTEGTQGHPSPLLLARTQDPLRAPTDVPHTLVPACYQPVQQEFWVLTSCPSDAHPRAGTAHLSTRRERPCLPAVAALRVGPAQARRALPPRHLGRGQALTQVGREGEMFSSGLFCSGVLGFFCLFPPGQF